ncbi:MAG: hypothetical protein ACOC0A_02000 [Planctomycetota bacterium]
MCWRWPGGELEGGNFGTSISNHYLTAFKTFSKWPDREGRITENPVKHLSRRKIQTRSIQRRMLTPEECARLLDTTGKAPTRYGIYGPERALFYRVLLGTGYPVGGRWRI